MATHGTKRLLSNAWEVIEVVLTAFITVYLIRAFIAQPFLVNGASMEPTYSDGNYLLIDQTTYYFRKPIRGDVVVFRYPGEEESRTFFIKRIIGLPGETVRIADSNVYVVSGDETLTLSEGYLAPGTITNGAQEVTLGEDEFFLLGDNRDNSFDSRNWGPLHEDDIIGLVRLRLFPVTEFDIIKTPSY